MLRIAVINGWPPLSLPAGSERLSSKSADMKEEETAVLAEKWEATVPSRKVSHYKVLLQAQTSKQWLKSEDVSLNEKR